MASPRITQVSTSPKRELEGESAAIRREISPTARLTSAVVGPGVGGAGGVGERLLSGAESPARGPGSSVGSSMAGRVSRESGQTRWRDDVPRATDGASTSTVSCCSGSVNSLVVRKTMVAAQRKFIPAAFMFCSRRGRRTISPSERARSRARAEPTNSQIFPHSTSESSGCLRSNTPGESPSNSSRSRLRIDQTRLNLKYTAKTSRNDKYNQVASSSVKPARMRCMSVFDRSCHRRTQPGGGGAVADSQRHHQRESPDRDPLRRGGAEKGSWTHEQLSRNRRTQPREPVLADRDYKK